MPLQLTARPARFSVHIVKEQPDKSCRMRNTIELSGKSLPKMGNMLHQGETSLGKHMDLDDAEFRFLLDPALNRVGDMRRQRW
jgi:hypothetical protein